MDNVKTIARQIVYAGWVAFVLTCVVLCAGGIRGCSNDFDRSTGNPKSFKWLAW